jgi:hypothetical protein
LLAFDGFFGGGDDRGRGVTSHDVGGVSAGRRVEGVTVQAGQDPAEGPFAGHHVPAEERVEPGPEAMQDILRGTRRPLPDRGHGVVADHECRARGQDQNHQQRMPKPPQPPRVGYLPEPAEQRRCHRQRVSSHRIHAGAIRSEFGFPQGQIGEVVNNRADRGR